MSRDPLADVWIAIHQRNAGRLALSEKIDAVLTRQGHILEIEGDAPIFPFRADECFQLGNVRLVDPAAQRKDHVPVLLPLNSEHSIPVPYELQVERHAEVAEMKDVDGLLN
ncbi:MAG: hypothetical protein ABI824_16115 [Acidobacteriota bacterium]